MYSRTWDRPNNIYEQMIQRCYVGTFYTACALPGRAGRARRRFSLNVTMLRNNRDVRALLFLRFIHRRLFVAHVLSRTLFCWLTPSMNSKSTFYLNI